MRSKELFVKHTEETRNILRNCLKISSFEGRPMARYATQIKKRKPLQK